MNRIDRVSSLDEATFVERYVVNSRPAIVTDAMECWPATKLLTPKFLRDEVGDVDVQIYDDLFDLSDITPMGDYIDNHLGRGGRSGSRSYAKAYSRFKDIDFAWADEIFDKLSIHWEKPYFFPGGGFVIPKSSDERPITPVKDLFPYRGLFVCAKGVGTRLHRDPYDSEALLCQFFGEKKVIFFHPEKENSVISNGEFVNPDNVDNISFPGFSSVRPDYEDILMPGEILFIPGGWFHHVCALSDSISMTWNFVHKARSQTFWNMMSEARDAGGHEVMNFFLRDGKVSELRVGP